jgi:hypothetical protein
MWFGAGASAAATFVGHYPWFATYNTLSAYIPQQDKIERKLARSAIIGFSSSLVSDTISNSIRVVKTYRQTYDGVVSYREFLPLIFFYISDFYMIFFYYSKSRQRYHCQRWAGRSLRPWFENSYSHERIARLNVLCALEVV